MRLTESQQRETPLGSDWQFAVERSTTRRPPLQRQVVDVTGTPNLPTERYRILLTTLADDGTAVPFDRPETSRRVRDTCSRSRSAAAQRNLPGGGTAPSGRNPCAAYRSLPVQGPVGGGRPRELRLVTEPDPRKTREDLVFDVQLEAFPRVSQRPLRTGSCRAEY